MDEVSPVASGPGKAPGGLQRSRAKRSGGTDMDGDDGLRQALLYELLVDSGEDEQLWALRQAFEEAASLPAEAFVVGEPVALVDVHYGPNGRGRRLRALASGG